MAETTVFNPHWDVVIVGAGIAGLSAATVLIEAGLHVLVLDKGRGVGGRMATRRATVEDTTWVWDHGAQFMRLRAPETQTLADTWIQAGLIHNWLPQLPQQEADSDITQHPEHTARYVGTQGMTTLPKALRQNIETNPLGSVLCSSRVTQLALDTNTPNPYWQLTTETEIQPPLSARAVILTAPVPQSIALLETCSAFTPEEIAPLKTVTYAPCLSVQLGFLAHNAPTYSALQHGALQWLDDPVLGWLGDNQHKGISTPPAWTVQATPSWSEANWDKPDTEVQRDLCHAVETALEVSLPPAATANVMRWRYSLPETTYPQPYFQPDTPAPLWVAGDAFETPGLGAKRIESAWLSGRAAASALVIEMAACASGAH